MVLAALAIVWIVVLGSYAKERFGDRRQDSVSAFRGQLSSLQRTHPGSRPFGAAQRSNLRTPAVTHRHAESARLRRKNILSGSAGAVAVSLVLLVSSPSAMTVGLAAVCLLAFSGYVALLVNRHKIIVEQQQKVRRLRPTGQSTLSPPGAVLAARRR